MSDTAPTTPEPKATENPPIQSAADAGRIALKGVAMGLADSVPGVSGGTMALILGIYDRFINAIKAWTPRTVVDLLKALPSATSTEKRPAFVQAARAVDLFFLVALGGGIVSGLLVGTKVIKRLIETQPAATNALFLGLVLPSIILPWRMIKARNASHYVLAVLGAAAAYVIVGLETTTAEPSAPFLFMCGAVAICAMVLPGVSGAYILKVLGQYKNVTGALHALLGGDISAAVHVGAFVLGMLLGILAFVRVLSWLLNKYNAGTLAVLTGLMIGALRSLWPFLDASGKGVLPTSMDSQTLLCFGAFAAGLAMVSALMWVSREKPA